MPSAPVHMVPTQGAHAPPTHDSPGKQACPHAPQSTVLCRLTHCPPQKPSPAPHTSRHAPASHAAPGAHGAPHAPQCAGFELTSTQPTPQICSVGKHATDCAPSTLPESGSPQPANSTAA